MAVLYVAFPREPTPREKEETVEKSAIIASQERFSSISDEGSGGLETFCVINLTQLVVKD